MCHGDITPIPTRWQSGIDQNYIDADQIHTCRDFGRIRDWTTRRFNGSLEVHGLGEGGNKKDGKRDGTVGQ